MPSWLAGKLPPERLPAADNVLLDVPSAPAVAITRQQVLVDGEVMEATRELERAGRLRKVQALFQHLKDYRQQAKNKNPDAPFPGQVNYWIDVEASALVVKSVFQTAAFAGFPNGYFVVRNRAGAGFKALPADAMIPPLPNSVSTKVSGRLPPEVIQRVVRSSHAKMRECYEAGLARQPYLRGKVHVRFVIDREGAVLRAQLGSSTVADDEVNRCVVAVFSTLRFPKPEGGIVTVVYPILFEPG